MRKIISFLILSVLAINTYSQDKEFEDRLIELGKLYRNFMFRNNPPTGTAEELEELKTDELNFTVEFIKQTITPKNELTSERFLKLPDIKSLRYIFVVRQINLNFREENPKDNYELIADILNWDIKYLALVDNYYDMLFSGIGNKNQPFDLTNVNFELNNYNLKDGTEKGVFFLKAMSLCGMTIWGYMNVVKPPNYKAAMDKISNFPKFNGQPYYQYLDLNFPDFKIKILKDENEMSYKEFYIDKYINTLVYHYECLNQKKKFKEQKMDLVLGSILKEKQYYKYSKSYKENLGGLFKTQEY